MDCSFDIDMINKILSLRTICCDHYYSCDLCPFSIENTDSEMYDCSFEKPIRNLVDSIFCEVDSEDD